MIVGAVKRREAVIAIPMRGSFRSSLEINTVIDTGFTGWLTLPPQLIAALGLRWHSFGRGIMADGTISVHDVYVARIVWDGRVRRVRVNELNASPLVGMALLGGCELKMQVRSRGKVSIKRLR